MPDFSLDEIYDDWEPDDLPVVWTAEEIADDIEDLFDENRERVFRAKVKAWSAKHWIQWEDTALRVGREARAYLHADDLGPAVVWAATAAEVIFRELTLRPIFVGFFLGEDWAEKTTSHMLRGRWLRKESRDIAKAVLKTLADLDVETFEHAGHAVWREIPELLDLRNAIVHEGAVPTTDDAEKAVNVVAGLYASVVPKMRELCGVLEIPGYVAAELRD